MRMTITIQDVNTKDGLTRGVFGTLNISKPTKDGKYDKASDINFVCNVNEIRGLPKIVRNIQVSVLGLKYEADKKKKLNEKRKIAQKSRKANKI